MATLAGIPITSNGLGLMSIPTPSLILPINTTDIHIGMTVPGSQISDEETFKVLKAALAAGANGKLYMTLHLLSPNQQR